MTRSGCPICHVSLSSNLRGGCMSAGFPCGAPLSTHLTMTAISSSDKEMSLLNRWTPGFNNFQPIHSTEVFAVVCDNRSELFVFQVKSVICINEINVLLDVKIQCQPNQSSLGTDEVRSIQRVMQCQPVGDGDSAST